MHKIKNRKVAREQRDPDGQQQRRANPPPPPSRPVQRGNRKDCRRMSEKELRGEKGQIAAPPVRAGCSDRYSGKAEQTGHGQQ